MADNKLTKDVYRQYAHKIVSVLKNEEFYEQFKTRVDKGSSSFKLAKKRLIQDISIDWINTLEEILPNLDPLVRPPRNFIVQEEDIVDVSLARSISTESVKFLAQHTNMISKVDKDGMVTPSKILNITKEESFEIYENRFIYTLLLKLKDFVTMRYDKIKKASATQDVLELDIESRFNLPSKKVTYRTEYFAQLSFDEVMRLDPDTLTKIERVAKIDRIITDFLSSSFAKSMRNSAPVRPPIMRTNVILKEPNFKKALTLWQFIETYNVTGGFSTSDEVEDYPVDGGGVENLKNMVTLNTMLFESLYDQHETDMNMEDKEFADFLRVGDMDFQKDELNRDEYAQKLDEAVENEQEEENVEEVTPQEAEDAETPLEQEQPAETPQDSEKQPDVEEQKKEADKEISQEVGVERPVEIERIKEMAPKADQEEVDLEPDAEKFDQHLFDVRKLYKRPDDDKLKQEDIAKVKDAIDRCLTSYRRIKQEEIDEREREDRIRRRREDMEKRSQAFKKLRFDLEGKVRHGDDDLVYFGIDPFSYQRVRIAAIKNEEAIEEERRKGLEKIEHDKNAMLAPEESNVEEAEKPVEETETGDVDGQNIPVADSGEAANENIEAADVKTQESPESSQREDTVEPEAYGNAEDDLAEDDGYILVEEHDEDDPAEVLTDNDAQDSPDENDVNAQAEPSEAADSGNDNGETVSAPADSQAENAEAAKEQSKSGEAASVKKPRKKKNIELVDESKVGVGGISFKNDRDPNSPFGVTFKTKKKDKKE